MSGSTASMRPQRFGCGDEYSGLDFWEAYTSFNEAAAFRLRRYALRAWFFSHRSCFNEAAAFRLRRCFVLYPAIRAASASMRPQRFGCGDYPRLTKLISVPESLQ